MSGGTCINKRPFAAWLTPFKDKCGRRVLIATIGRKETVIPLTERKMAVSLVSDSEFEGAIEASFVFSLDGCGRI